MASDSEQLDLPYFRLYPETRIGQIESRRLLSMDLIDLTVELGREVSNHPGRLAIYDEGLVAVNLDRNMVISRLGARLNNLARADLIEFDPNPLLEVLGQEQPKRGAEEEALLGCRVKPEDPAIGPEAYFAAELLSRWKRRFLVHLQPAIVNTILASPRARQFADRRVTLTEAFSCGSAITLIPYVDPGAGLAREIRHKVNLWHDRARTAPKVIFLQNNGMLVLGDTYPDIIESTEKIIRAAEVFVGSSLLGGPLFLTVANLGRAFDYRKLTSPRENDRTNAEPGFPSEPAGS
jgi:hypothetical protein